MATITIDTYRFVKTLTAAGMPERQAQAMAEELQHLNLTHLATKQDLQIEIHKLKSDLLKWVVPLLLGQIAVFGLLVQWLVP